MTQKKTQSDQNDDASSIIILAPDAWKQQIQAALKESHTELRFYSQQKSGIVSRWQQLQAEQAVNLAAEAAHHGDSRGAAIVVAKDLSGVSLALHHDEQTELHLWTCINPQEALELLVTTISQIPGNDFHFSSSQQHLACQQDLFTGLHEDRTIWALSDEKRFHSTSTTSHTGILSGSFNPLHSGHRNMREAAAEILGGDVAFEMTLRNADKPPLDYLSLAARSGQFSPGELLLTDVPTFTEKAELMPGKTFIIGWDTAVRVLDDRFYELGQLNLALERFADRESRFLVAARREAGRLKRLKQIKVPGKFRDLFAEIPPELFEEEISSTSLREAWLREESNIGPPLCMMIETHTE